MYYQIAKIPRPHTRAWFHMYEKTKQHKIFGGLFKMDFSVFSAKKPVSPKVTFLFALML